MQILANRLLKRIAANDSYYFFPDEDGDVPFLSLNGKRLAAMLADMPSDAEPVEWLTNTKFLQCVDSVQVRINYYSNSLKQLAASQKELMDDILASLDSILGQKMEALRQSIQNESRSRQQKDQPAQGRRAQPHKKHQALKIGSLSAIKSAPAIEAAHPNPLRIPSLSKLKVKRRGGEQVFAGAKAFLQLQQVFELSGRNTAAKVSEGQSNRRIDIRKLGELIKGAFQELLDDKVRCQAVLSLYKKHSSGPSMDFEQFRDFIKAYVSEVGLSIYADQELIRRLMKSVKGQNDEPDPSVSSPGFKSTCHSGKLPEQIEQQLAARKLKKLNATKLLPSISETRLRAFH